MSWIKIDKVHIDPLLPWLSASRSGGAYKKMLIVLEEPMLSGLKCVDCLGGPGDVINALFGTLLHHQMSCNDE